MIDFQGHLPLLNGYLSRWADDSNWALLLSIRPTNLLKSYLEQITILFSQSIMQLWHGEQVASGSRTVAASSRGKSNLKAPLASREPAVKRGRNSSASKGGMNMSSQVTWNGKCKLNEGVSQRSWEWDLSTLNKLKEQLQNMHSTVRVCLF